MFYQTLKFYTQTNGDNLQFIDPVILSTQRAKVQTGVRNALLVTKGLSRDNMLSPDDLDLQP